MLACPKCQVGLVRKDTEHGIAYFCPDCGGRVVALKVLKNRQADKAFVQQLWRAANAERPPAGRACPHCRKSMKVVQGTAPSGPLMLDVCTFCCCDHVLSKAD